MPIHPNTIRVLLVGARPIARAALRLLLETRPSIRVVGEAPPAREAVSGLVARERPRVVLLDVNGAGTAIVGDLRPAVAASRMLVLTSAKDPDAAAAVARLGAAGAVSAFEAPETLFRAVEAIAAGEPWFDARVLGGVLREMTGAQPGDDEPDRIAELSRREREVIRLLGLGLKNRDIAERLSIAEGTVRHHLTSAYAKLGVGNRLELLVFAYRNGLAARPRR